MSEIVDSEALFDRNMHEQKKVSMNSHLAEVLY